MRKFIFLAALPLLAACASEPTYFYNASDGSYGKCGMAASTGMATDAKAEQEAAAKCAEDYVAQGFRQVPSSEVPPDRL